MLIKGCDGWDKYFAFLGPKRTSKLEVYSFSLCKLERLRAAKRAFVSIAFNDIDTLEAKILLAGSITDVRLFRNKVADDTLILLCLFVAFDIVLWLVCLHPI